MTETSAAIALLGIVAGSARAVGGQVAGLLAVVAQLGRGAISYVSEVESVRRVRKMDGQMCLPAMWPTEAHEYRTQTRGENGSMEAAFSDSS